MLAKLTTKNQVTLTKVEAARSRLEALGIGPKDVAEAIRWARQ